jgi:hypothetical protein
VLKEASRVIEFVPVHNVLEESPEDKTAEGVGAASTVIVTTFDAISELSTGHKSPLKDDLEILLKLVVANKALGVKFALFEGSISNHPPPLLYCH